MKLLKYILDLSEAPINGEFGPIFVVKSGVTSAISDLVICYNKYERVINIAIKTIAIRMIDFIIVEYNPAMFLLYFCL